jgi:DNA polymerase-4
MSRRQYALPQRGAEHPPDDTGCTVLHVDMDAFFASASLLSRPELVGTPVIIGGGGNRGVVLSATYEARKFGVASAMPMSRARRLCPTATVIAPDHHLYSQISAAVMATFETITPVVEPLSLDEAFLDVSGSLRRLGNPARIGQLIRDTVHDEQGITCSVGVAPTKFVAKLASGLAKPDGMVVVPRDEVVAFVQQLPVGALWGVGGKSEEVLVRLGLRTIGDVAHAPVDMLRRAIGEAGAERLHELSWGRDPRTVTPGRDEKSIGHETTFETDRTDAGELHRVLLQLADGVGQRLRRSGVLGRTIAIKLRFADFTTITRSRTLAEPTDVSRRIYEAARELYDQANSSARPVRLIGVRAEQLVGDGGSALGLWDDDEDWREAEQTVDAIAERFGAGAVRPAALLKPVVQRRFGHGDD